MTIKAKIKRDKTDYDKAYKIINKIKQKKSIIYVLLFLGLYLFFIFLSNNYTNNGHFNLPEIKVGNNNKLFWTCMILFSIIFWVAASKIQRRSLYKTYPNLLDEEEVIFDDEGMAYITKNSEGKIKWSRYTKAVIANDIILLFPNSNFCQNFPKRFFSDTEYQDLSTLIQNNINNCKSI